MHRFGKPVDHGGRVILHVPAEPVQYQTHKSVFIKVGQKLFIYTGNLHFSRFFFHHADQQILGYLIQIVFHLLPADGMVDVHDKRFIFQYSLKNL